MKRPLTGGTSVCETNFSAILRRHTVVLSLPCAFKFLSHIILDVNRTVSEKTTLFLPSLACACGVIGSLKQLYIAFQNVPTFLSWFGVSDESETTACQQLKQNRTNTTTVRVARAGHCDTADRSRQLKLFIFHTCKRETARNSDGLERQQVSVVCSNSSSWDEQNSLAESFSTIMGSKNCDAMREETIGMYD